MYPFKANIFLLGAVTLIFTVTCIMGYADNVTGADDLKRGIQERYKENHRYKLVPRYDYAVEDFHGENDFGQFLPRAGDEPYGAGRKGGVVLLTP